jgi:hypothetical protein
MNHWLIVKMEFEFRSSFDHGLVKKEKIRNGIPIRAHQYYPWFVLISSFNRR